MSIRMLFVLIIATRDPMTKISKLVAPWEVPIYRQVYGDHNIEIVRHEEVDIDELPDADEEFLRLENTFGNDPETKQRNANIVYGNGADAVDKLAKAIKAGQAEKVTAKSEEPGTGPAADAKPSVEAAQKVYDDGAKPGKDKVLAREAAYIDPLADAK